VLTWRHVKRTWVLAIPPAPSPPVRARESRRNFYLRGLRGKSWGSYPDGVRVRPVRWRRQAISVAAPATITRRATPAKGARMNVNNHTMSTTTRVIAFNRCCDSVSKPGRTGPSSQSAKGPGAGDASGAPRVRASRLRSTGILATAATVAKAPITASSIVVGREA